MQRFLSEFGPGIAPLAVLVVLLVTAGSAPAGSGPSTFAEAKELASQQERALLIEFFTTW
jgi:hypothetical protein